MVCRNPGPRLHTALASVWTQQGLVPELVVIDGASTDGTREWLEGQRPRITALVSEPDGGIYEAMNKAVARASGDWLLFLGADDTLADPTVLGRVAPVLAKSAADIVAGEARFDDGRRYPAASPAGAIRRNFLHHQATFYRRRLLAGQPFDATLRIMADYDLNLRLLRSGAGLETHPLLVAECASGGASDSGAWAVYREEIAVRHRHFPIWRCALWDAGSVVRYLRKQLVRRHRR